MPTLSSKRNAYAAFCIRTLAPRLSGKREEKFSTFVEEFERYANNMAVPSSRMSKTLRCLLQGSAQHFASDFSAHSPNNYDALKQALAEKYRDPSPGVNPDNRGNSAQNSEISRKPTVPALGAGVSSPFASSWFY